MAGTGKPLIISTGMATEDEIDEAVVARRVGAARPRSRSSSAPARTRRRPESVNLRAMPR